MEARHAPEFDRARTNVTDGLQAVRESNVNDAADDLDYFATEAQQALAELPDTMPYVEDYRSALDKRHFAAALKALANIGAHVRESDTNFTYPSEALDRIDDDCRQFDI